MVPSELVEDLPDVGPEFIELPDVVDEPLPMVLPELIVELDPVPIVLPELGVDGVVVVDDDDGMPVVPVVPVVVVVVVGVVLMSAVLPVMLEGVVVVVLEGVVVLVAPEGVVVGVVVLDGVVVVPELELDCAIAAPPPINNEAAAMATVVFKNEPMV